MAKTPTVWDLEPHTAKKHQILRRYLDAWLPIISRWNGRVLYVDGFAGPGEYSRGEDGSPVIVLKAARGHTYPFKSELVCIDSGKRGTKLIFTQYRPSHHLGRWRTLQAICPDVVTVSSRAVQIRIRASLFA